MPGRGSPGRWDRWGAGPSHGLWRNHRDTHPRLPGKNVDQNSQQAAWGPTCVSNWMEAPQNPSSEGFLDHNGSHQTGKGEEVQGFAGTHQGDPERRGEWKPRGAAESRRHRERRASGWLVLDGEPQPAPRAESQDKQPARGRDHGWLPSLGTAVGLAA